MKVKYVYSDNKYNRNMNRSIKEGDYKCSHIHNLNDDSKELVQFMEVLKNN